MIQDIEKCVRSNGGWRFSQVQLFALENQGFWVNSERRMKYVVKTGFGSVELTQGGNFALDAWQVGLKKRYFKTFQSLLNYLKKNS